MKASRGQYQRPLVELPLPLGPQGVPPFPLPVAVQRVPVHLPPLHHHLQPLLPAEPAPLPLAPLLALLLSAPLRPAPLAAGRRAVVREVAGGCVQLVLEAAREPAGLGLRVGRPQDARGPAARRRRLLLLRRILLLVLRGVGRLSAGRLEEDGAPSSAAPSPTAATSWNLRDSRHSASVGPLGPGGLSRPANRARCRCSGVGRSGRAHASSAAGRGLFGGKKALCRPSPWHAATWTYVATSRPRIRSGSRFRSSFVGGPRSAAASARAAAAASASAARSAASFAVCRGLATCTRSRRPCHRQLLYAARHCANALPLLGTRSTYTNPR